MNCPFDVFSAIRMAEIIPNDIISPEKMSPIPGPTFVGVFLSGPVMPITPPIA